MEKYGAGSIKKETKKASKKQSEKRKERETKIKHGIMFNFYNLIQFYFCVIHFGLNHAFFFCTVEIEEAFMCSCGAAKEANEMAREEVSTKSIMKEKHKLIHALCPRPVLAKM